MNKQKLITSIKLSASIILLGFVFYYIYSLSRVEITIFPANVYPRSFALAGSSSYPTKLCLISKQTDKLFGLKLSCEQEASRTHLITQENMNPNTTYKIWALYKTKLIKPEVNTITTKPSIEELPLLPFPAYGTVQNIGEGRVNKALVILSPQSSEYRYPLATRSNPSGNYAFDLNNIDPLTPTLSIQATYDGIIWNELITVKEVVSPIPPITVTENVQ